MSDFPTDRTVVGLKQSIKVIRRGSGTVGVRRLSESAGNGYQSIVYNDAVGGGSEN